MNDNNIDTNNMDSIDSSEGNGSLLFEIIISALTALGLGFLLGSAGKKKAVDKAYKRGYSDAADIFEKKFKLLHESFVNQEKSWKENEEEYLKLIADYEDYIEELESENADKENAGKIAFFENKLAELRELEESS